MWIENVEVLGEGKCPEMSEQPCEETCQLGKLCSCLVGGLGWFWF